LQGTQLYNGYIESAYFSKLRALNNVLHSFHNNYSYSITMLFFGIDASNVSKFVLMYFYLQ